MATKYLLVFQLLAIPSSKTLPQIRISKGNYPIRIQVLFLEMQALSQQVQQPRHLTGLLLIEFNSNLIARELISIKLTYMKD